MAWFETGDRGGRGGTLTGIIAGLRGVVVVVRELDCEMVGLLQLRQFEAVIENLQP